MWISDRLRGRRDFYIRGLREFEREPGYLIDTLGHAQDRFKSSYQPLIDSYVEWVEEIECGLID